MELHLTFCQGVMTGEGRDRIGAFLIRGRYQVEDGQSWWTKGLPEVIDRLGRTSSDSSRWTFRDKDERI